MVNIKLLNRDSQYCAFNIENFSLFSIDKATHSTLSHFFKNGNIKSTSEKFGVTCEELNTVLTTLGYNENYSNSSSLNISNASKKVSRITLHVSNDCNLRCKYCYASGGSYGKHRNFMTLDTAKRFVDFCCENYTEVGNIVFFGGEPFLNCQVIEFVCNYFHEKHQKGDISKIPNFGAITNGTITTDRVLRIIRDFFSFITVSIDGPKDINDENRVTKSGNGSFDRIEYFLRQLSSIPKLDVSIEATFTQQHIDKNYTRKMIEDYFLNEFKFPADVVDEMSLDKKSISEKSIDDTFESPWLGSILNTVVKKRHETKCQILRNTLAISTTGGIYPCHMNIGDGMSEVSSIWKNKGDLNALVESNSSYNLKNNTICNGCWARNLCGGCSRTTFYNCEINDYSSTPNTSNCDNFRHIVSLCLLKICEIRKDPVIWHKILEQKYNPVES